MTTLARAVPADHPLYQKLSERPPQEKIHCVTLQSLETEEGQLYKRLEEIEKLKRNLEVRAEEVNGEIVVYGLSTSPIVTTVDLVRNFLDNEGPGKMRTLVGRSK